MFLTFRITGSQRAFLLLEELFYVFQKLINSFIKNTKKKLMRAFYLKKTNLIFAFLSKTLLIAYLLSFFSQVYAQEPSCLLSVSASPTDSPLVEGQVVLLC